MDKILDPAWRLAHLYRIVDKNSHLITYQPNSVQRAIHASPSRRRKILKARQFGVTTDAVLRRFDSCIWSRNKTICILAHKQAVLDKIFGIVRTAYKNLPEKFRPVVDKGGGSRYEMRFPELNSMIYTTLEVRAGTIHELHISEAAFIPKERLDATLQAVPIDGVVEVESTPCGLNHFYDFWNEADDGYQRLFFPWFFHSEYHVETPSLEPTDEERELRNYVRNTYKRTLLDSQLAFRRMKIRELGTAAFRQEYPEDEQSCFLASGSNPFDAAVIKDRLQSLHGISSLRHGITVYEPHVKGKTYVIGADVAEGVRSDYSVASCFCVEERREVAFYRGHLSPSEFADKLKQMAELYYYAGQWPVVAVERNNHGHAVLLKLNEVLCYPGIWVAPDGKPGHHTTILTRPLLVDTFIEAVNSSLFEIRTRETFAECLTLVDNGGKIEAEDGKHDDCVIATALAIKLVCERLPTVNIYRDLKNSILV